jgi:hypothetical protein
MVSRLVLRVLAAVPFVSVVMSPAAYAQQAVTYFYTWFDADKTCRHTRGRGEEDYGSWRCAGYAGIDIYLSAGDQRMNVSFGPKASREVAASQTLPQFNSAYKGVVEWRIAGGKPFAAILRWNVRLPSDGRTASGRVLVVTRLNPGGVCHVGYVDARTNTNPNEVARHLADTKARAFNCDSDKAEWIGEKSFAD